MSVPRHFHVHEPEAPGWRRLGFAVLFLGQEKVRAMCSEILVFLMYRNGTGVQLGSER